MTYMYMHAEAKYQCHIQYSLITLSLNIVTQYRGRPMTVVVYLSRHFSPCSAKALAMLRYTVLYIKVSDETRLHERPHAVSCVELCPCPDWI